MHLLGPLLLKLMDVCGESVVGVQEMALTLISLQTSQLLFLPSSLTLLFQS